MIRGHAFRWCKLLASHRFLPARVGPEQTRALGGGGIACRLDRMPWLKSSPWPFPFRQPQDWTDELA